MNYLIPGVVTFQFFLSGIQFVFLVFLYWPKVGEHLHKLSKIDSVRKFITLKKGVYYPFTQWIDSQFRYSQKIIPWQCSTIISVQSRETGIQSFDLIGCDCKLKVKALNQQFLANFQNLQPVSCWIWAISSSRKSSEALLPILFTMKWNVTGEDKLSVTLCLIQLTYIDLLNFRIIIY